MGTYYPAPTKPTLVDTSDADVQPVASGGAGSAGFPTGAASPALHTHAGPLPASAVPTPNQASLRGVGAAMVLDATYRPEPFSPVVTVGSLIVACGVGDGSDAMQSFVLVYDSVADVWTHQPIQGWAQGVAPNFGTLVGLSDNFSANHQVGSMAGADSSGRIWCMNQRFSSAPFKAFGYFDTAGANLLAQWTYTDLSASFPHGTSFLIGCCVMNDQLYALFQDGTLWSYPTQQKGNGSWTQHATTAIAGGFPMAMGACYAVNRLVVADNNGATTRLYNPSTNTWGAGAALAGVGSAANMTGVVAGRYLVWQDNSSAKAHIYDAVANTWVSTPTQWGIANTPPTNAARPIASLGKLLAVTQDTVGSSPSIVYFDPASLGSISGSATGIYGHLTSMGSNPAIAAAAGLGTAPPAPTVNGTDVRGTVGAGTGTIPAAGTALTVTFATPYTVAPGSIVLAPLNAATAALQPYVASVAAGSFTIGFGVAPAASQAAGTYGLAFHVFG